MTREAVLIASRDQGQVKGQVRQNAEQARYWEHSEQAAFLYRWAVLFKDRLLDPVLLTDRGRMPDPVISFDRINIKALAGYRLTPNPQGLLDEITFNTAHFVNGQWRYASGEC